MSTWYDAVAYCNWLNEQEGIPKEQWCYLPNDQGEYAEGMTIVPDCLQRTGYRLPTEAEWEFACRAGSITSRYYGQNLDLDNHYAWTVQNSLGRRTALVGSFKPNDLGLFDMLGNVWIGVTMRFAIIPEQPKSSCGDEPLHARGRPEPIPASIEGSKLYSGFRTGPVLPINKGSRRTHGPISWVFVSAGFAHSPRRSERDEKVRDSLARSVRSSTSFQSSGQTRSSYRTNYHPNFGTWPWGFPNCPYVVTDPSGSGTHCLFFAMAPG